jgi:hypothetical protein
MSFGYIRQQRMHMENKPTPLSASYLSALRQSNFTFREEYVLRMCENRVLRRVYRSKKVEEI